MPLPIELPTIASDFEMGTIAQWHKSVGDPVEKGDVLFDVETDKAVVEVEATHSGVLGAINVPGGSESVPVGEIVGVLLLDGESDVDLTTETASKPEQEHASKTVASDSQTIAAPEPVTGNNERLFASPMARRIAIQNNVDISTLQGRGPDGRILRSDVEAAIELAKSAPLKDPVAKSSVAAGVDIPNDNMRRAIARRLTKAKQDIPHFYLSDDIRVDALLDVRTQLNEHADAANGKLSINDFIVKAAALALRDNPAANASWSEDAIHRHGSVDVSIAVAIEGGLITPVVRSADNKSLTDLSSEIKVLVQRAVNRELQPDEYTGGGFSISNLGMYGVKQFSAIINPPQSCILAVGAAERRPLVVDDSIVIATQMTSTLSVDHRSVDGAVGAKFLASFKYYVERPALLLS